MKSKLNNNINIKKLSTLLVCGSLLAGCVGGGSGETQSTSTNNGSNGTTIQSQNALQVVNHSGSVIDHFQILSESGAVILNSTTGLQCAVGQNCDAGINKLITSSSMTTKFYDNNNQLIGITNLDNNTGSFKYMTAYANSTIMGANLFQQLVAFEKSTPATVLSQLNSFFAINNSNNTGIFATLGDYYHQQLINGKIKNEQDFYQQMTNNFAAKITAILPIPPAYTPPQSRLVSLDSCSVNGYGTSTIDTMFNFISPLASLAGLEVGSFLNLGKLIFDTACPSSSSNPYLTILNNISEQLKSIQSSISALGTNLDSLRAISIIVYTDQSNNQLGKLYDIEEAYNNKYKNFLTQTGESSILDYVNHNGGIDKLYQSAGASDSLFAPGTNGNGGLISEISDQNLNISMITDDTTIQGVSDLLQITCADPSKIVNPSGPGDIIETTDTCNMQAIYTSSYISGLIEEAKVRMLDEAQAINSSQNPAKFGNGFSNGSGSGITWAEVPNIIESDTQSRLNKMLSFVQNNTFTEHQDLVNMNITVESTNSTCYISSEFTKTKVFPSQVTYKNESYDSITVGGICNGQTVTPRPLLPGGIYHIDTTQNKFVMDNYQDWEVNESINPLISPNAAAITPSGPVPYPYSYSEAGFVMLSYSDPNWGPGGYTPNHLITFRIHERTANDGAQFIPDGGFMYSTLGSEGRNEFEQNMFQAYSNADNTVDFYLFLYVPNPTKLFIPIQLNWEGYKGFAIWAEKGYGLRADVYGSSNLADSFIDPFDGTNYSGGYINVQGWRNFTTVASAYEYNEIYFP
ncbi:MAG: hypothetical protein E6Q33_07550 [Neisseriales bacterium]|nr:MAG: hypothetical protein E6Q33_07550 [Neisseriales bacterium]